MAHSKHTPPDAIPPDDDDVTQAAAAAEFAQALEAFEATQPAAGEVAQPAAGETAQPAAGARSRAKRAVPRAPRVGDRVRGKIVSIAGDVVLVEIGQRAEAVADAREFRDAEGTLTVAAGDSLELHVVETGEQLVLARAARRRARPSLEALRQARATELPVLGKVTAVNKGGLAVDVDGVRAFCPLAQVDLMRVADVSPFVGRVLEFRVTEVDDSRGRVVLSRRAILLQQQAEAERTRLAQLAPGQELEGTITRLEPFGAFVDVGGLEGMVHVSELSHARVTHPRDVVAAGDRVRVRVLRMEEGRERRPRVALSLRATTPDPWATATALFAVGARVPGVVVRLTDFGAFVNLAPGVDGLVHVSQVSDRRIQHVRDVLSPGQAVEAVVLAVEPERKRISLSIRDTLEQPVEPSQVVLDAPAERKPEQKSVRRPERERNTERRPEQGSAGKPEGRGRPERSARPERPERSARPERSGRPERSTRPERSERSERSERPERSARPVESRSTGPEPLTPMQLAFQKAREAKRLREEGGR